MTEEISTETPIGAAEEPMTFASFGLKDEIMQGVNEAGFSEPTPIQQKAIPVILEGRDIIGQALTGTGKTAAFGLPVMNKIAGQSGLRFLILVPTRELAAQVSGELFKLGRHANIHTAAFTGGQSYSRQEKMLKMGIDALVATPGRLIDLIDSGHFKDINPEFIVVDEADEMLDMGFLEDVKKIFDAFPGPRQTMLFSATMPRPVVELAEKILINPVEITTSSSETANNDIEQFFFVIEDRERIDAIVRLIDAQDVGKAIIFCRTKEETDALNILLGGRGYNVNCLHGDMEQAQRSRVMAAFRRGEIDILVATDVAARGLDVDDVTHVFNFHLPFDPRGYVHRIGRTGRAGKTGTAITLVTPRELRQLEAIKRTVGAQIENRLIPSRAEVTSLRLKKIFHDVHDYQLDMEVLRQVQTLTVNQDIMVLLAKLVGHSLAGGADQGPEHIGIDGSRLDDLLTGRPKRGRREQRQEKRNRRDRSEGRRRTPQEEMSDFEMSSRPTEEYAPAKPRRNRRNEEQDSRRTPPEAISEFERPTEPAEDSAAFRAARSRREREELISWAEADLEQLPRRNRKSRKSEETGLQEEAPRRHGRNFNRNDEFDQEPPKRRGRRQEDAWAEHLERKVRGERTRHGEKSEGRGGRSFGDGERRQGAYDKTLKDAEEFFAPRRGRRDYEERTPRRGSRDAEERGSRRGSRDAEERGSRRGSKAPSREKTGGFGHPKKSGGKNWYDI